MDKEQQIYLVKESKKGDDRAFSKLCEAYQVILYSSAYKLLLNQEDVADCIQETEIRAWMNITALKDESSFNTWIFRIMMNVIKDYLNKKIEVVEFEEVYMKSETHHNQTIDLEYEFSQLSNKYRVPLVLYYYNGFNIKEIAKILNVSANTVKTRLSRGKKQLKTLLEE